MNVYTRTTYGGSMNKIFSQDREIGDYWLRADVKLLIGQPFQVVIEAIVGGGYAGDIAIDDTSFTPGCVLSNTDLITVTTIAPVITTPNQCAANGQFLCLENSQCISKTKVCDFVVDCPLPGGSDEAECGTCTFDNNNGSSCGWKDYSYGSLKWNLGQGPLNLGPTGDHTTGNGYYAFVPDYDWYGLASFRTPQVGPSGVECQLKFWYYMNHDETTDSSRISIYAYIENNGAYSFNLIEHIRTSTGPQWKQAIIRVGTRETRFAIGISRFSCRSIGSFPWFFL